LLKPTDFKADELLFQATASGGLSLAPDSLLTSARFAAQLVEVSGAGQYSAVDLQKKLAGKAIGISPYIGSYEHGLGGQASPKDVETMFQLAYLYFTAPRLDTGAVTGFLGNLRSALVNRNASPDAAFQDTLSVTLSQHHFWTKPFSDATVAEVNPNAALDFYRQRFSSAAGFTFAIVGTFNPDSIKPLVERYIASIPGGTATRSRDPGMRPPETVVERTVRKGLEPKSSTAIVFTGPAQVSLKERWILSAMGEVLQIRLREELREELSGTYSVSVGPSISRVPREQYSVSIRFGSDPKLADSLVRTIFSEIDAIQRNGPKATDLAKVKESFIRSRETALKENGWWLSQIMQEARDGDPAAPALEPYLAGITVESVRDAAKKYLDRSRYVRVTLLPQ
jgi:zinc protease